MRNKLLILSIYLFSISLTNCTVNTTSAYKESSNNSNKKFILKDTFADLCNGSKVAEAPEYDKTAGTLSSIAIYFQPDAGKIFQEPPKYPSAFPAEWLTDYSNAAKTQLVACITVSARKEKKRCDFSEEGKNYQLIKNDTKYNVKVFEAKTGTLVTEKDLDTKVEKVCPMIEFFDGEEKIEDADYKQPAIEFLKPLVKQQENK